MMDMAPTRVVIGSRPIFLLAGEVSNIDLRVYGNTVVARMTMIMLTMRVGKALTSVKYGVYKKRYMPNNAPHIETIIVVMGV